MHQFSHIGFYIISIHYIKTKCQQQNLVLEEKLGGYNDLIVL